MNSFQIVAHRGVPSEYPENTIPAFQKAVESGADAVELDVRLTKDKVPVVYHYYYLDKTTSLPGPIFNYSYQQLSQVKFLNTPGDDDTLKIPTLRETLETIGGQIGLEIEIKGPEPECTTIIGEVLQDFRSIWGSMEITSYEVALLLNIKEQCPGITTDLLYPLSQPWMKLDVVAFEALHKARLAQARAVHLHPSQLSYEVVHFVRSGGVEIHAWDVNDEGALQACVEFEIPKVCTDNFEMAARFRERVKEWRAHGGK
jgi:glycerophosphoryl diester phosphodiesterase